MALPKFSFSGWNSQSLAPKVPVTPVPTPVVTPGLIPPANATGTLVGTTSAANTNLPAWLQAEVDKLNAQDALRKSLMGSVVGGGTPAAPAFDPNLGVAAVTNARANYNQQVFGMNEAARLQNLIQQRNQLRPTGGFGFNNPMDVPRQLGLDREIEGYRNVNLPLAASAVGRSSGWVNPFRTF